MRRKVEFFVGPPALLANAFILHENSIHGVAQSLNLGLRVDTPEKSPHTGLVRFDKTKESVVAVIGATHPNGESLVEHPQAPSPVLCEWFSDLKPSGDQALVQKVSEALPPNSRIDCLLLPLKGRETIRTKLDMSQHKGRHCRENKLGLHVRQVA